MTLPPEWILGTIMLLMMAVIGFLFRQISETNQRIDNVITLIDGVKDDYVKRIDNDGKMGRIEKTVDEVRLDMKEVSAMLVRVLVALGKQV